MRASKNGSLALVIAASIGLGAGSAGCAKRLTLTPAELARVEERGVKKLRVYTSKKLIVMYEKTAREATYDVEREVQEKERLDEIKYVVAKKTAGQILEEGERNGAPILWVTFDPSCTTKECALGFVQTEDERFRLAVLPEREGAKDPRAYRVCKKKRGKLELGKLASLAELNDVYLRKKRNGKVRTIELEILKVTDKGTRTKVQRTRGID